MTASVSAIRLSDGTRLLCRAVVVGSGTFLRGLMHTGEAQTEGGRVGEASARGLSGCLARLGFELGRLKTGTPPRLDRDTIDFSQFERQPGDEKPMPFSYMNEGNGASQRSEAPRAGETPMSHTSDSASSLSTQHSVLSTSPWSPPLPQVDCFIGGTSHEIHEIIRANLHRAPMYSGQIHSTGPRYCPSIEDKVVRFADKTRHQIFLEPEGLDTNEIYCNGISTSLPADVQEKIIRLVSGLEKTRILRFGYAVEYDMVWPTQIRSTLETKLVSGLFLAGQINGTSGYEEAAAQGLVAGVNAAQYAARGLAQFVLRRDQAYIGVMIDDLVTKPPTEPYRMFTSRAEHRLHLRNDNADERLTSIGRDLGLVDDRRWSRYVDKREQIDTGMSLLQKARVDGIPGVDWLRRSDADLSKLLAKVPTLSQLGDDALLAIEVKIKYQGYITRQDKQIERFAQLEHKLIPTSTDYASVVGLRNEARQKFSKFTPRSLGQALRISGITPADVTVLAVHLSRRKG